MIQNAEENTESLQESEESCDDETFSKILFEPDDFEPYVAKPKVDSFGLGYRGLSRHSILGAYVNPSGKDSEPNKSHLLTSDKGKKVFITFIYDSRNIFIIKSWFYFKVSIRGQAFGVGALEDEDDDIYAKDDLSGYDFSLDVSNKTKEKTDKKKEAVTTLKNVCLFLFIWVFSYGKWNLYLICLL